MTEKNNRRLELRSGSGKTVRDTLHRLLSRIARSVAASLRNDAKSDEPKSTKSDSTE